VIVATERQSMSAWKSWVDPEHSCCATVSSATQLGCAHARRSYFAHTPAMVSATTSLVLVWLPPDEDDPSGRTAIEPEHAGKRGRNVQASRTEKMVRMGSP